jgi:hypothetical protein
VNERYSPDDLMRFLDGEMSPDERARVEVEIGRSTELQHELAIYQGMRSDFLSLSFHPAEYHRSVWDQVNATVARPIGWLLIVVGITVWTAYGAYVFSASPLDPWEKLATGAVVIGVLTLLTSVIWERYREWGTDPYKDVYR